VADAAAVDHEEIPRAQELTQIGEGRVDRLPGGAGQHQEAGGVASGERMLGDGRRWQVEVEIGGLQNRFDWPGSRSTGVRPKC